MKTISRIVRTICLLSLVLCGRAAGQDFYFSGETIIPVTISDSKVTVQVDSSATFFDVGSFIGNHPCLSTATPSEELGRGCITIPLETACTYATAAPDLASDPYVLRVLPVYVTEIDGAEFAVTDLVSVQFDETLTTDSCMAILATYGLRFDSPMGVGCGR